MSFSEIRKTLIDPSSEGRSKREIIAQNAAFAKGSSVAAMGGMGFVIFLAYLVAQSYPKIGGMFGLIGVIGFIGAREMMVVSGNTEKLMKEEGVLGLTGLFNRGVAATSKTAFTNSLTQDTWVVGPLFGSAIEATLLDKQN